MVNLKFFEFSTHTAAPVVEIVNVHLELPVIVSRELDMLWLTIRYHGIFAPAVAVEFLSLFSF